ncbi:MAG: DUF58 domain-containing protein [Verrucomicrobiales bacterium]|nr:DUF58 domain-containing protein [Verrucomicrobiales bacterium]
MVPTELFAKVRQIEIKTNRLVTELLSSQYTSAFKGHGMEFDEVREYQPGDDVRFIDWNVTARMNTPFIKKFVEERELTVMLAVDLSGSGRYGSGEQSKRELAAEMASVLALAANRNHDKVGLILFTEEVELFVPPRTGKRHSLRVVREVLHHQPRRRGTDLRAPLEFLSRISARKTVAILISDFLDALPEKPLRQANRRHDVVAIQVSDPGEHTLPLVGRVALEDAETGEVIELSTRQADTFAAKRAEEQALLEEDLGRLGIDSLSLRTGEDYVRPLSRFFAVRERRRAFRR